MKMARKPLNINHKTNKLRAAALAGAAALLLAGCACGRKAEEETQATVQETSEALAETGLTAETGTPGGESSVTILAPELQAIRDADGNLLDQTLPADFSVLKEDFKDEPRIATCDETRVGGEFLILTKLYTVDSYDAVSVSQLAPGDTIIYGGEEIQIETLEEDNGDIVINGDLDNGGCRLRPDDGGTYIGREWDDYPSYTEEEEIAFYLSEDVVLRDSSDPANAEAPVTVEGYDAVVEYLEKDTGSFTHYGTTLRIESGLVVEITRGYTP